MREISSQVTNSRLGLPSSRRDADNGDEGDTTSVIDENDAVDPGIEDDVEDAENDEEEESESDSESNVSDHNGLHNTEDDDEDDGDDTLVAQFERARLSHTASDHHAPSSDPRNETSSPGPNSSGAVNENASYITDEEEGFYLDSGVEAMRKIYEADLEKMMEVTTWDELLPADTTIEKIAEASFAEVFRITAPQGTSIMKVMRIKIDADCKTADMDTAIDPHAMLSELRIMNAVTDVHGFVMFKGARLVHGVCSLPLKAACDQYMETHSILKEDLVHAPPSEYLAESLFLIIELGDAGDVLENLKITTVDQLWDVIIGTVVALSAGEEFFEFEVFLLVQNHCILLTSNQHRDLHENNICYTKIPVSKDELDNLPIEVKYGRSGIMLTLIDFGLSRAKLRTGAREVIYNDLDGDMALFRSEHDKGNKCQKLQYETYRRQVSFIPSLKLWC